MKIDYESVMFLAYSIFMSKLRQKKKRLLDISRDQYLRYEFFSSKILHLKYFNNQIFL